MWLLALEACVAFGLFIFIVWWTMFQGRKPEMPPTIKSETSAPATPPATSSSTSSAEKND